MNQQQKPIEKEKLNDLSSVKKVVGVISGKGGVGKSLVTALMADQTRRLGWNTAIFDADITGPSIPKMFGLQKKVESNELGMYPIQTQNDISVMSVNLLLKDESDPVIWRGPLVAGAIKQFWTDVIWNDIDYMFIDMPPGTGDVALTVCQSLPIDGLIVVTSPQELVSMIVKKAVNMAKMMQVPILGVVENFSSLQCPHCHENIELFGESHLDDIVKEYGMEIIGKVPIDPKIAKACDQGTIEELKSTWLEEGTKIIVGGKKK